MNTERLPRSPAPIKGAVPRLDVTEVSSLWANFPNLRPKNHAEWLRHFINLDFNLTRLQAGWVPAAGKLEWKLEFPRFMFEDMQHAHCLRERLNELPRTETCETDTEHTLADLFSAIGPAEHAATFFQTLYGAVKRAGFCSNWRCCCASSTSTWSRWSVRPARPTVH